MKEVRIGTALKQLRRDKGYTLVELAKATGIQIATLSRIENNIMTGTVEAHLKLAYILGVEIAELYKDLDEVIRKDKIQVNTESAEVVKADSSSYQALIKHADDKRMLPQLITIEVGGESHKEKSKDIEVFIYILNGNIEAIIGKDSYNLSLKNSLYFKGASPHFFRNTGKTEAKLIYVRTK